MGRKKGSKERKKKGEIRKNTNDERYKYARQVWLKYICQGSLYAYVKYVTFLIFACLPAIISCGSRIKIVSRTMAQKTKVNVMRCPPGKFNSDVLVSF